MPRKIRMAPTGMGMGMVGMTAVFLVVYVAVARGIWGQAAPAQQQLTVYSRSHGAIVLGGFLIVLGLDSISL